MRSSSWIILKSLLEGKEHLTKFLDENAKEHLAKIDFPGRFSFEDFQEEKIFETTHYSWFIDILKSYDKDAHLFLFLFEKKHALKLLEFLHLQEKAVLLSNPAKDFLRFWLICELLDAKNTLLPMNLLSNSDLFSLLSYTKSELIELINFLALFDLSLEMKKIVDTKILKKISGFLSKKQLAFLKKINIPQSLISDPLLIGWDLSKESFFYLLHKRGLYRLAIALATEHLDFLWYVSHRLDVGRGATLIKLTKEKLDSSISKITKKHILETMEMLKA